MNVPLNLYSAVLLAFEIFREACKRSVYDVRCSFSNGSLHSVPDTGDYQSGLEAQ